jgi:hypothetical protein
VTNDETLSILEKKKKTRDKRWLLLIVQCIEHVLIVHLVKVLPIEGVNLAGK